MENKQVKTLDDWLSLRQGDMLSLSEGDTTFVVHKRSVDGKRVLARVRLDRHRAVVFQWTDANRPECLQAIHASTFLAPLHITRRAPTLEEHVEALWKRAEHPAADALPISLQDWVTLECEDVIYAAGQYPWWVRNRAVEDGEEWRVDFGVPTTRRWSFYHDGAKIYCHCFDQPKKLCERWGETFPSPCPTKFYHPLTFIHKKDAPRFYQESSVPFITPGLLLPYG